MASTAVRNEFPREGGTPTAPHNPRWRGLLTPAAFMAPALILLGVWVVYPAIATMIRSLYNDAGSKFVWFDNYDRMFSDALIRTAIKNNFLWVLAIPLTVTAFGLIFAVLTERVAWAPAFKVVIFLPLAISLFAVGVIWRVMYQQDPSRGVINATIGAVRDAFKPAGVLSRAQPSTDALAPGSGGSIVFDRPVGPGGVVRLGLTGMSATEIPESATQAVDPKPQSGAISGVVWRDFKPGGGTPGKVEQEEVGLPGVTVELRDASGKQVDSAKTGDDGSFSFAAVNSGAYKVGIGGSTFAQPFKGVNWLGPKLILPAIWIAFLWTSIGFAMVVIGAGLASMPRDVLEAARTDGGTEFQIFRRVTVPLLAPVLTVVIVTQIIGVLKVFDLVYSVAPGPSQNDATVIAYEMWRRSFSGQNRFGFGSAISTFLLLLFVPFLVYRVYSMRKKA